MDYLERAAKSIDKLEAAIKTFNEKPSGMYRPTEAPQGIQEIAVEKIPIEIVSAAEAAIDFILAALNESSAPPTKRRPQWWRNIRAFMTQQRFESGLTHQPVIDAFNVLDRHINDNSEHLAGIILLRMDLDRKIVTKPDSHWLQPPGNPYSHKITFVFDPKINANIDDPFHKLVEEIAIDTIPCPGFLRQAVIEAQSICRS